MGKGRRKKNTKQSADSKPSQSINILLPENVQVEELTQVIARAIVEAEEIKAQEEEARRDAELQEWHRVIGCKDYDNKLLSALNQIKVFFKILFLPKKHIKGNTASTVFMKSFISFFFWIMEWLSLLLTVSFVAYIPITGNPNHLLYAYFIPLAFISFVFSRIFRMASIETDKLDDRNYLLTLFAAITSFTSMIFAAISVIKGA